MEINLVSNASSSCLLWCTFNLTLFIHLFKRGSIVPFYKPKPKQPPGNYNIHSRFSGDFIWTSTVTSSSYLTKCCHNKISTPVPVCSFLRPSVISPISIWAKHLAPIDQQTCSGRQSSSSWFRNPGRTTRVHSSKLFSLEFRTCQMIYR